jgi:hypothetical protein
LRKRYHEHKKSKELEEEKDEKHKKGVLAELPYLF